MDPPKNEHGTIWYYESIAGTSDMGKPYKFYNGQPRRHQVTLTKLRMGYHYTIHYVQDAFLEARPVSYQHCEMCKAPVT